ncbi:Uncharacterised protein [Escherichia coli]|nr:Uncharacterised protein [Escherichia coli]
MSGNNVFDGLFSSPERDIAASHGNPVFIYHVDDDKIAKSRDLDARFQEVYAFLHNELDTADVEEIADRVMWDNNSDIEVLRRNRRNFRPVIFSSPSVL